MTVSLKHRLQLRFVLLSLAALLILQSLIVGFSLWRNYRQITLKADRMIMTIISDPDSSEVADARYFTATYDLSTRSNRTFPTAHLTAHRISTEHRKRILLPDDLNMARSFHFFSVKSAFDYCFFRYWVL